MAMKPTAPSPATPAVVSPTTGFSLKPSKQTATILGVLIGLCLLAAASYGVVQQGGVTKLDADIRTKQQQVDDSQLVANHLIAVESDYQKTRSRIRSLETQVSESDYVPTLLKQIEHLAQENGMRVDGEDQSSVPAPEPPTDPEARKKFVVQPYDKEMIVLRVQGRYWNIAQFLYRLGEFPKILSVESLSLRPQKADPDKSPLLSVTINMTGYLFKPTSSVPAPDPNPTLGVPMPGLPPPPAMPKPREI